MAYSGKSPNKFVGNIARSLAGGGSRGSGQVDLSALAGRSGLLKSVAWGRLGKAPSVVATAGASGMSGRIQGIESRLEALESNSPATGSTQPAVAPPSDPLVGDVINSGQNVQAESSADPSLAQAAAAAARRQADVGNQGALGTSITGGLLGGAQSQVAASEELGSLMASPFTMRQRANMGTLKLKNK